MQLRQIIHLISDFSDVTYISDPIVYVESRNESNVRSSSVPSKDWIFAREILKGHPPHLCHLSSLAELTANGWRMTSHEQHEKSRHLQGDDGKSDSLNNTATLKKCMSSSVEHSVLLGLD